MATVGTWLVERLAAWGIDTVYGIPGYHTIELYRGLGSSPIAHVTPRHEQGAGFMADGHWRATGRVAAAFVITGPGLTNITTAMAQAKADSAAMLVISSVNRRAALGAGDGDLHEVPNQGLIAAQCAVFSQTIHDAAQIEPALARAFAVFEAARPGPVHLELPVDLFSQPAPPDPGPRPAPISPPVPDGSVLDAAAAALAGARRPLIVVGGGAVKADVAGLAARLGAPVVMTTNARGVLEAEDPLAVPASPSLDPVREMLSASDVALALGTEIGRTDYDMYDTGEVPAPAQVIRADICPQQLNRGWRPDIALPGDAARTVAALMARLSEHNPVPGGEDRAAATLGAVRAGLDAEARAHQEILATLTAVLPDTPVVGDSVGPVYTGNLFHRAEGPRRWFNAATGYGALGYGLPAAIGAAKALGAPVVCLAGDGGLQFSIPELGTAVEEGLPVITLVWNNRGYGEIARGMDASGVARVGVDLHTPDFVMLARGWGAEGVLLEDRAALGRLLAEAVERSGPTLIEIPSHHYGL